MNYLKEKCKVLSKETYKLEYYSMQMSNHSRLIHKFNVIPIKISASFFTENHKMTKIYLEIFFLKKKPKKQSWKTQTRITT